MTHENLIALLKEARSIIRASSSRNLAKDWDRRATQALAAASRPPTGGQRIEFGSTGGFIPKRTRRCTVCGRDDFVSDHAAAAHECEVAGHGLKAAEVIAYARKHGLSWREALEVLKKRDGT